MKTDRGFMKKIYEYGGDFVSKDNIHMSMWIYRVLTEGTYLTSSECWYRQDWKIISELFILATETFDEV